MPGPAHSLMHHQLSSYQSNYFILKYVVLTYIKYVCFEGFVCHLIMYLPTYVKYVWMYLFSFGFKVSSKNFHHKNIDMHTKSMANVFHKSGRLYSSYSSECSLETKYLEDRYTIFCGLKSYGFHTTVTKFSEQELLFLLNCSWNLNR